MASSRLMRKSPRNASPMNNYGSATPEVDLDAQRERVNAGDDWVEPSLRAPIPSFQEYNIERGGVLDQMAPLGTMPPLPKLKLRVKQYDPNVKKSRATKNGDGGSVSKEAKESATVQETSASRRRSESRKLEDRPASKQQQHVIREKEDDRDYTPKPQATKSARQGSSSVRLPVLGTPPNSKTQAGQEALRCVVEAAVSKSKELGNEKLGLAIQKLFEESLNNRTLADLLDAVLSQKPTPRQAADFQAYIKEARRQLKSSSSKPSSKSSSRKQSTSRTPHTASDRVERHTSSQHRSHQTNGRMPAANGNDDSQPPSKRLKRSGSVSSTSSLSSTQSLDLDPDLTVVTEGTPTPSLTARGRPALGPKLHTFSHKGPGAPAAGNKRERQAEVVSATNADQNPPDSPEEEEDDDEEETVELATRKRKLRKSFDNVAVGNSHQRQAPKPVPAPRAAPPSFPPQKLSTTTREDKEDGEDIRSPASSTFGEFLIPPPPGMLRTSRSRGATPSTLGRPKHTGRRGARVKMSPMKKKNGVVAGTARRRGGPHGSAGDQTDDNGEGENSDSCSTCGGNGELLCCDGCPRSFHFSCFDPPMDKSHPPEGEWYCVSCQIRYVPKARPTRGMFAVLKHDLRKRNPDSFELPPAIRDYYEGVKTGDGGEYEEVTIVKNKVRTAAGYDDVHADTLKIKDSKNNPVLCFKCGKSSLARREIISCDYCSLHWHLDCLNPPMANPPVKDAQGRPKHSWMCPAHIDQELAAIGHSGRMHKMRRPKNVKVLNTFLPRGLKNNGLIEIENDPSDSENDMEVVDDSVVYRLPEKGIKLDFIDRLKREQEEYARRLAAVNDAHYQAQERVSALVQEQQMAFNTRTFTEKKAALNLAYFAKHHPDIALSGDRIQSLVNTLVMEAPDKVVAMCDADDNAHPTQLPGTSNSTTGSPPVPPTPPISDTQDRSLSVREKQTLLLLQNLIGRRIKEAEDCDNADVDMQGT